VNEPQSVSAMGKFITVASSTIAYRGMMTQLDFHEQPLGSSHWESSQARRLPFLFIGRNKPA